MSKIQRRRYLTTLLLATSLGCSNLEHRRITSMDPITKSAGLVQRDASAESKTASEKTAIQPASFDAPLQVGTEASDSGGIVMPADGDPIEFAPIPQLSVMTLEAIEQIALANNPALSAANAASRKAAGLFNQVGTKANPNLGYFGSQIADAGTDQHGVFVEQEFVRGNKLALNRDVLRHTTHAQRWEADVQRYRVLTDVRVRYFEAAAAQSQRDATFEFAKVAGRGVEVAQDRRRAEEGSQVEVLQAQVLLSEIELAGQQYSAAYRGAWADLAAVAGMPYLDPAPLAIAFDSVETAPDWDDKYAELLARSPELAVANELVCEKQANLKRQQAQPIPNVTAQMGAGYDNGTGSGMINVQLAAPIPVFNKNSGNISAAYADYCRAIQEVKRIEMAIKSRLARSAQEFDAAKAAVQKYEDEILPGAQESLSLSEQAYAAGEIDFLQVLIVRRNFFESKLRFIESQARLAQANARIEGLLLSGGLDQPQDYTSGDGLRGQSFGGQ